MSEPILAGVIVALLVYVFLKERLHASEMKELIRAVLAKNLTDFTSSSIIEEEQEKLKEEEKQSASNVPFAQLSEEEFSEHINKINTT